MSIETVAWRDGKVRLIDQTALPAQLRYVDLSDWRDVVGAIRDMIVRGAPAIGCTAALGFAMGAQQLEAAGREEFLSELAVMADTFRGARPTAVNLGWAIDRLQALAQVGDDVPQIRQALLSEAVVMLEQDLETNRRLGRHGAALLPQEGNVLTHCNAGALACVGYGTALGVIRAAVEEGKRIHVYADETRPRLQGMKLTAWELMQDGIPITAIADNMAAVLLREGKIDCVVVGADRIASNGDTANKIGTYGLAVQAKFHGVPFYVAAPLSTIDFSLPDGSAIPIEHRSDEEMTHIDGHRVAPEGMEVWNPAFDVTPAELVGAIITEAGVARAPYWESLELLRRN